MIVTQFGPFWIPNVATISISFLRDLIAALHSLERNHEHFANVHAAYPKAEEENQNEMVTIMEDWKETKRKKSIDIDQ